MSHASKLRKSKQIRSSKSVNFHILQEVVAENNFLLHLSCHLYDVINHHINPAMITLKDRC